MRRLALLALLILVSGRARGAGTSTTFLWLPTRAVDAVAVSWPGTDVLRCVAVVPEMSLAGITRMAWNITGGLGGGGMCSMSIYTADGATLLGTSGATDCSGTGNVAVTGISSFSLTGGTQYLVCTCANTNGGSFLGGSSAATAITTLQNSLGLPLGVMAGNSCLGAVPPSTLGTLSPVATNVPVLILAVT